MNNSRALLSLWSFPALGAILMLLIYFGADIIDKGIVLNNLTPWGPYCGVGTLLWLCIILLIWLLFIHPVLEFRSLLKGVAKPRARAKKALTALKKHRGEATPQGSLYARMSNAIMCDDAAEISQLLLQYEETGEAAQQARELIRNYCKLAAVGTVISTNTLLDSIILIGVQMRMITRLAAIYGYSTSPVFLMLCMGWVRVSAILFSLFAENVEDVVGEAAGGVAVATFGADLGLGKLSARATEFMLSWVTVYVTGRIFMATQAYGRSGVNMKNIMSYRKEAYIDGVVQVGKFFSNTMTSAFNAVAGRNTQEPSSAKQEAMV